MPSATDSSSASLSAPAKRSSARARLGTLGLAIVLLGAIAAIASGFGARFGVWQFRFGFTILEWAIYSVAVGAAVSLLVILSGTAARAQGKRVPFTSVFGLVIGAAVIAYPAYLVHRAGALPRIHDITTDTDNPPAFVAALPYRVLAENTTSYGGAEIAAQQKKAYPEVAPVLTTLPPTAAFDAALATAKAKGWQILAVVPAEGRIEASDTTFWYHFTDDIVIRIAANGSGSRIDVRSESRVGLSDCGVNARRVIQYLVALKAQLGTATK